MSTVQGKPYPGPFTISLDDVKDEIIDLPDGEMRGLRSEQDGLDLVKAELEKSMPTLGEAAGIQPKVYQRFKDESVSIEKLRNHERELMKALEVVRETRAKKEHDRENDISLMVDAVKSTAQRTNDKAILGSFQETIKYNAQIANKGVKTRKKNAEAKPADPKRTTG